jgi:hypothetical protein
MLTSLGVHERICGLKPVVRLNIYKFSSYVTDDACPHYVSQGFSAI